VSNGDETFAIRRLVTITDDTRPAELAKTRLWKLAFTPSGPLVYGFVNPAPRELARVIDTHSAGSPGD
jgi:hypothetical protein